MDPNTRSRRGHARGRTSKIAVAAISLVLVWLTGWSLTLPGGIEWTTPAISPKGIEWTFAAAPGAVADAHRA